VPSPNPPYTPNPPTPTLLFAGRGTLEPENDRAEIVIKPGLGRWTGAPVLGGGPARRAGSSDSGTGVPPVLSGR
jgi:hypothetical protein